MTVALELESTKKRRHGINIDKAGTSLAAYQGDAKRIQVVVDEKMNSANDTNELRQRK